MVTRALTRGAQVLPYAEDASARRLLCDLDERGVRYPYNDQMGLGYEGAHSSVPGVVTAGTSEQNQRGFYQRWAAFMDVISRTNLASPRGDTRGAGQ